jgi:hypothetical protein
MVTRGAWAGLHPRTGPKKKAERPVKPVGGIYFPAACYCAFRQGQVNKKARK